MSSRAKSRDPGALNVIYIVTTSEKMCTALTDGKLSQKYFFGRRVESDWKEGSAFKMCQPNGTLDGGRL